MCCLAKKAIREKKVYFSKFNILIYICSVKFAKRIILCFGSKRMSVCFMMLKQRALSQCVKESGMTSTWRARGRLDYRSPHSKFYGRPFWLVSWIEFSVLQTKVKHLHVSFQIRLLWNSKVYSCVHKMPQLNCISVPHILFLEMVSRVKSITV